MFNTTFLQIKQDFPEHFLWQPCTLWDSVAWSHWGLEGKAPATPQLYILCPAVWNRAPDVWVVRVVFSSDYLPTQPYLMTPLVEFYFPSLALGSAHVEVSIVKWGVLSLGCTTMVLWGKKLNCLPSGYFQSPSCVWWMGKKRRLLCSLGDSSWWPRGKRVAANKIG